MHENRPTTSRRSSERGATLVLAGVAMTGLLIVVAIVVDLGAARAMKREAQSVADLATLAAAQAMTTQSGTSGQAGCNTAVAYLRANISGLPVATTVDCSAVPASCDENTSPVITTDTGTAAPYTVQITYPVPDSEIQDGSVATVDNNLRDNDGQQADDQCDRIEVAVGHERPSYFASVVGRDTISTEASAVARRVPYEDTRSPNLWLLAPHACDVLGIQGGGTLKVGDHTPGGTGGLITTDSDATGCNSNQYVISTGGSGVIHAAPNSTFVDQNSPALDPPGQITSIAFTPNQIGCVSQTEEDAGLGEHSACNPSDQIDPTPEYRPTRATRGPVDWKYNCKSGYPDYEGVNGFIQISDCPFSEPAYMDAFDDIVDVIEGGLPSVGPGTNYVPCNSGNRYNVNGTERFSGNTVFDCPDVIVGNGDRLILTGGSVLFMGGVSISNGVLTVNADVALDGSDDPLDTNGDPLTTITQTPDIQSTLTGVRDDLPPSCDPGTFNALYCFGSSAADAAFLYQRSGGLSMSGSSILIINEAAWIQDERYGTGNDQNIFGATGGGLMWWTPPREGPFESLSLWSECCTPLSDNVQYSTSAGGTNLEGVFFTPEADPFNITANTEVFPQAAQFISRSLELEGQGTLDLGPAGIELVTIPPPSAYLIR